VQTNTDITIHLGGPSLEYPRADPSPKIHLAGCLPLRRSKLPSVLPDWWPELEANTTLPADSPTRKKVVFVTQGTIAARFEALLLPTLDVLRSRDDMLVVAVLAARGASLPPDFALPPNARVIDHFPYDRILDHADVFVTNGGYGGFTQAIMQGVPLVMAGVDQDKRENGNRGEYAGVAVNLRTAQPARESIAAAVDRVIGDGEYKRRVLAVKAESEKLDVLSFIDGTIRKFAGISLDSM